MSLSNATLDQYDQEALARYIGWLPQDIVLFDGSIAENIARMEMQVDMKPAGERNAGMFLSREFALPMLSHDRADQSEDADTDFENDIDPIDNDIASKVAEAAKATGSHETILAFPKGYEFQVWRGGAAIVMAHRRNTFAQCGAVLVMEQGQIIGDVESLSENTSGRN